MLSRLRYTFREMWASVSRNTTLSIAAILTSGVTLLLFGLTLLLLGLISDLVYAVAAGALGRRLDRAARTLRYVSGVVYLALGVATAFAGRK